MSKEGVAPLRSVLPLICTGSHTGQMNRDFEVLRSSHLPDFLHYSTRAHRKGSVHHRSGPEVSAVCYAAEAVNEQTMTSNYPWRTHISVGVFLN